MPTSSKLAAFALCLATLAPPALADNAMGYQLLTDDQAASLTPSGGSLGLSVGQGRHIDDAGLSFELLVVRAVRPNAPAAAAGLKPGDQIIAVDGHVFPSVAAFAGYVRSVAPGGRMTVDALPAGAGPAQAQRVAIVMGADGQAASPQQNQAAQAAGGQSTGTRIALAAAAALFRCYQSGCFSKAGPNAPQPTPPSQ